MNKSEYVIQEKTRNINEMFNTMKYELAKPKEQGKTKIEIDPYFENRIREIKNMISNLQKKIDEAKNALPIEDHKEEKTKETPDTIKVNNVLPIIVKSQTPLTLSKTSYKAPDTLSAKLADKNNDSIRRHFSALWDDYDAVDDALARNNENYTNNVVKNCIKDIHKDDTQKPIGETSEKLPDIESTDILILNNDSDTCNMDPLNNSDKMSGISPNSFDSMEHQKEFDKLADTLSANQSVDTMEAKVDQSKFENLFNELCMNSPYYAANAVTGKQKEEKNEEQIPLKKNDPLD